MEKKERLTKDMYQYFVSGDYAMLKSTVAQLKEVSLRVGDERTFYKAWGNEVIKSINYEGHPIALEKLREMREYVVAHDSKFGLYTLYYATGFILNMVGDIDGAMDNYKQAAEILKHYFPDESLSSLYNSMSHLSNQKMKDSLSIYYSELALADPRVTHLQRVIAWKDICIAWGWLKNKPEFDKAYAKLNEIDNDTTVAEDRRLKVEIFRAALEGDYARAHQLALKIKSEMMRRLYIYKSYEWAGDYRNTFRAYKIYREYIDSVNKRDLRNQAKLYEKELNVAMAENESKDLRLANKRLMLEQMANELEHKQLEAEAAMLKLENEDIELAHANIKLKNDSLQRLTQEARLNEYKSRLKAQQQSEHAHHIMMLAVAVIALLTIVYLTFYLYRRQRQMKRLKDMNTQLQSAYDQLEQTTTAKERIESELRIARDIQMSMLPHIFPEQQDFQLHARMTPAKEVGGDLYDFFMDNDMLYLCIGDVSGKGVPASMFMSVTVKLFHTLALKGYNPVQVATMLNESLCTDNENGMFVTMFIATVDLNSGRMDFCNAGHPPHCSTASICQ